jgi:hypothetical protein
MTNSENLFIFLNLPSFHMFITSSCSNEPCNYSNFRSYVNNFSNNVIQQEWKNQDKKMFLPKCGFKFSFAN